MDFQKHCFFEILWYGKHRIRFWGHSPCESFAIYICSFKQMLWKNWDISANNFQMFYRTNICCDAKHCDLHFLEEAKEEKKSFIFSTIEKFAMHFQIGLFYVCKSSRRIFLNYSVVHCLFWVCKVLLVFLKG